MVKKKNVKRRYVDEEGECLVCGSIGVDLHHVYTRGAHGVIDESWNLMKLCHEHHVECEYIGLDSFVNKGDDKPEYAGVKLWLIANMWEYDTLMHKWRHYDKNINQGR